MQRGEPKPGTKLIAMAAEDAGVLRRAGVVVRRALKGIVPKLKSMFSKVPIRNIEE